jgi:hypothetical protein
MTTGRNERCPCGSGKKYKQCCESSHRAGSVSGSTLLLGTLVALVLAGGLAAMWRNSSSDGGVEAAATPAAQLPATGQSGASGPPFPEPPGPAPKGQVWSAEHGHYHQQPTVQIEANDSPLTASVGNTPPPQPGGEAPPGMVWSEAHGHYHPISAGPGDPPETSIPRSQIPRVSLRPDGSMVQNAPQGGPTGAAPEGMVWSEEHGHWHQAEPASPSPAGNPQQRR